MLDNVRSVLRSMVNAALGKAEKRQAMTRMDKAMGQMQSRLQEFHKAVAIAIAHENRIKRQLEDCRSEIERLDAKARQAVLRSGQATGMEKAPLEEEARSLLRHKIEVEQRADMLNRAWSTAQGNARKAREQYERTAAEIGARARQLNEARVLHQLNQSRREMLALFSQLDLEGTGTIFSEGFDEIREESDRLDAMEEVTSIEGDEIDRRLSFIATEALIDNRYEEIQKELLANPDTSLIADRSKDAQRPEDQ
ncbi:PspA/IM30 family protein [bacterium]|nr:PspA/IM30 family protein [candidate division CSSED10-310 bacterium]